MKRLCRLAIAILSTLIASLWGAAAEAPSGIPINPVTSKGYVVDWVFLGPFHSEELAERQPDGVSRSGFHRDFLEGVGGEPQAVIPPGLTVTYTAKVGKERTVRAQGIGPAFDDPRRPDFNHIRNQNTRAVKGTHCISVHIMGGLQHDQRLLEGRLLETVTLS